MTDEIRPVRSEFLPFARPSLGEEEEAAVVEALRSGWLSTGPKTAEFERVFAEHVGARHAVGLNSCTAALHLALLLHDVGAGDEVITTPITFAATSNVVCHTGARPVFAEVDEATLNIDPADVERRITPATRAVIAVHFAGAPCPMRELEAVAAGHGIALIEDAAHAVGTRYGGRPIGSGGNLTAFSFYATKNISTGEGGMLVTDDEAMAEKARVLRLHGMSLDAWKRYGETGYRHWDIIYPGYKYNMTDPQAALGIAQLAKLDGFLRRRAEIVSRYDEAFRDLPGIRPLSHEVGEGCTHAHHLYVLLADAETLGIGRDELMNRIQAANVGVGVHFRAVHLHPYYREALGYRPGHLPVAEKAGDSVLSIPLYPGMKDGDVEDVIEAVFQAVRGG